MRRFCFTGSYSEDFVPEVRVNEYNTKDPASNQTTQKPRLSYRDSNCSGIVVFCSSGQAKTILQGTVKGGRRQGRQKKRWEDNIREWTGLGFAKSQRPVENKEKWTKLVVKSSVVLQQPSWLRDRW